MTNENEQDRKKPLSLGGRSKLELRKPIETSSVRQSFSHGRSKTVTVEVKRKRTLDAPPGPGSMGPAAAGASAPAAGPVEAAAPAVEARVIPAPPPPPRKPVVLQALSGEERAARMRALQGAIRADEDARAKAEEEARRRAIREQEEAAERAAAAARQAILDAERAARDAEEARNRPAEAPTPEPEPVVAEAATPAAPESAPAAAPAAATPGTATTPAAAGGKVAVAAEAAAARARPLTRAEEDEEEAAKARRAGRTEVRRPAPVKRTEVRRRTGKLTVVQALDSDMSERVRSLASVRRARERERQRQMESGPEKVIREVIIPDQITVQDLAARMATRGADVIKALMRMGVMATINQVIDSDTAELIVAEFGHTVKRASEAAVEVGLRGDVDDDADLEPRAPVVTVMGHVDHGKTSLLDALRKADVAAHEAGGITQHIGAYRVTLDDGSQITFIDTPGHEAFTEMRARGANVTDVVILVVAADDGIMPQTVEAIQHAKAADVPIVVAINKIDKPEANAQKVRTELLQHGLVVEELGGDILAVEVSAKTGKGLDKLRETILLQAEILDLKANPNRSAEGVVVEARLDRGRGPVATVLVQRGTLRVGDIFVAGGEWGKVRALVNDRGDSITSAGPATPVEVLGLTGTPNAGDELQVVESESRAREVTEFRQRKRREGEFKSGVRGTVEQMLSKIAAGETKDLAVVIKTDVQGSMEAIVGALTRLSTDEVQTRVLHAGVGAISEADVTLARASGAYIIAFNVRANAQARDLAKRDGVDIRYYSVIYNVVDDVKAALTGLLAPSIRENFLGYAQIREVFNITKVGNVAGCMITEGLVKRGSKVRLLRDNVVIHEGMLKTLRRFKEEVREVKQGFECGMAFENYADIKIGDQIECFEMIEEARTL